MRNSVDFDVFSNITFKLYHPTLQTYYMCILHIQSHTHVQDMEEVAPHQQAMLLKELDFYQISRSKLKNNTNRNPTNPLSRSSSYHQAHDTGLPHLFRRQQHVCY